MTIYEFILEHSTYGKELFESKEKMLQIRKMSDEEKLAFLKDYDKKRKPKRKYTRRKKVDKPTNKKYTNKTNGGKSEAKSVPRKRKRKTTSKGASD
tara:strand:+ start:26 stop:313 length:288 start_codon:yes stop_codon:yes gene_type:complete